MLGALYANAQIQPHSNTLAWSEPVPGPGQVAATGFNVYVSATSGTGYQKIASVAVPQLTFTDADPARIKAGAVWFYVVTATATVYVGGKAQVSESGYSNEVQCTTPADVAYTVPKPTNLQGTSI
jgi:hypothetical protein